MSKPNSGHFSGTIGYIYFIYNYNSNTFYKKILKKSNKIDPPEHPVKNYSSLSIKEIRKKVKLRTATKNEFKKLEQNRRLANRRKSGIRQFWNQEREKILNNQKPTRNWSAQQINDIISGKTPKLNGKSIQGHHIYAVNRYPHLANKGEFIFPVTFHEHLYGCHGGNFKNAFSSNSHKFIKKDF